MRRYVTPVSLEVEYVSKNEINLLWVDSADNITVLRLSAGWAPDLCLALADMVADL